MKRLKLKRWKMARLRSAAILVGGYAILVATSAVHPGTRDAETTATMGVRVILSQASATGSSSLGIEGSLPGSGHDAGTDGIGIRLRGQSDVLGHNAISEWHKLCTSLATCSLEFEFVWPTSRVPEPVEVNARLQDTLRGSFGVCTAGDSFSESTDLRLEPLEE